MTVRTLIRDTARALLKTDNVSEYIRKKRWWLDKKIYRKHYGASELKSALQRVGVARGRVVWVQSSWNAFHAYQGKPSDVLALLQDIVGPSGTLVMPVFPINPDPNKVLLIDTAPSSTGLLTELFRRTPNIQRSIHLTSSVAALGPLADYLVKDHHKEPFTWGRLSPFWRLTECDALLVGLGNGRAIERATPLHAVECMLYDEVPYFRSILRGTVRYRWQRRNGESGEHEFLLRQGRIRTRNFRKHFPRALYHEVRISGLDVYGADAKATIERAIALARRGITIYVEPRPTKSEFVTLSK